MTGVWVRDPDAPAELGTEHLDGVPWWKVEKLPRRWHRCRAQTRAWMDFRSVERCACGAIRLDGRGWSERNSTRKSRRRKRRR